VAIELDAKLAPQLRNRATAWPNVEVVEADILKFPLESIFADGDRGIEESAGAATRWRVYGNLPYYITSPILHLLFSFADRIASAHVVMQLEVAERVVSKPSCRDYGYLSVASQFFSQPKLLLKIPPGAFRPRPKVASALVELRFPGPSAEMDFARNAREPIAEQFLGFIHQCFAQKRKTLANNLKNYFAVTNSEAADIPELLKSAMIPAGARAEELSLEQFVALFRAVVAVSAVAKPRI
jgi:16S rRNA (adenine1518-N6/adenine1519-N6)-dimethyltransferase